MGNMSHCRWRNTASDLQDCIDAFHEMSSSMREISNEERKAFVILTCNCVAFLENVREMMHENSAGYEDIERFTDMVYRHGTVGQFKDDLLAALRKRIKQADEDEIVELRKDAAKAKHEGFLGGMETE